MRRLILLTLAMLVATAACGGNDVTNPDETKPDQTDPAVNAIAGVYTLRTVNGAPLPYDFLAGTVSYAYLSDTLTLKPDKVWSEAYHLRENSSGRLERLIDGGRFTLAGDVLKLFTGAETTTDYGGTFRGDTLTIVAIGLVQRFVRQR